MWCGRPNKHKSISGQSFTQKPGDLSARGGLPVFCLGRDSVGILARALVLFGADAVELLLSLAVAIPQVYFTTKGVFLSSSSAQAFFGTTRLASGFLHTKKQAPKGLLFFMRSRPQLYAAVYFSKRRTFQDRGFKVAVTRPCSSLADWPTAGAMVSGASQVLRASMSGAHSSRCSTKR